GAGGDGGFTAPRQQFGEQAFGPVRAVGKADARFNVVLVVSEAVLNTILDLLRRRNVFVARAKVEGQIRIHLPVIFGVEVRFVDPVLQKEGAVAFLESRYATGQKRRVGRAVGRSAACRAEVVKTSREVVGVVIKLLATNVRPDLDEMPAA